VMIPSRLMFPVLLIRRNPPFSRLLTPSGELSSNLRNFAFSAMARRRMRH
jgi:hypothetical protein